jgi:hypothetical protein
MLGLLRARNSTSSKTLTTRRAAPMVANMDSSSPPLCPSPPPPPLLHFPRPSLTPLYDNQFGSRHANTSKCACLPSPKGRKMRLSLATAGEDWTVVLRVYPRVSPTSVLRTEAYGR